MTFKWLTANRLLTFLFLSSVFFLAIIKINDTDTWMHLAFGRLIWTLKGWPSTEPFVYTNLGNPFTYTSWLFSVLYYLAYASMNVYGVILLKAATITAALFILLRDSLRPHKNYVVSIAVLIVMVFLLRNRFVERPETFMMVFLSFSIFSLNAYIHENKKYIYFLPIIHLIWANCHSSINLMFIPFAAVLVGGVVQSYLKGNAVDFPCTPSISQLKTIVVVFLASFAVTFLNPNVAGQYLYGYKMLLNPWYKQEILELQAPTWQVIKWPYLISLSVLISFLVNIRRISLINLFLIIPFMYLAFVSIRFVYILGIVAAPILSKNLASLMQHYSLDKYLFKRISIAIMAVITVCYPILFLLNGNARGQDEITFGFGIEPGTVPEGALQYMDRRGIYGRILSTFEWGGYVNWRDFPKRSVFIDPRGEIPSDLLDAFNAALSNPSVMKTLTDRYDIKAVLIKYPSMANLYKEIGDADVDPAFSNPTWALVYWDDTALLYLKRGGEYQDIIAQDEYKYVKPARELNIFGAGPKDSGRLKNIIGELRRCADQTDSVLARYLLMYGYNEEGLYHEAIAIGEKYQRADGRNYPEITKNLAVAYEHIGDSEQAVRYYKKTLSLREDADTLFALGKIYLNKGDTKGAASYLRKALDLDASLISIYPVLIRIYQQSGDAENVAKTTKMFSDAQKKNLGAHLYKMGMQAYLAGNYREAIEDFSKSIEYDAANPTALSDLAYAYYDLSQLDKAFELHKRALAVDPDYANSYFGLALIYKKRGNLSAAKRNWEKYLDLEPNGYFSRRAMQEIEKIRN